LSGNETDKMSLLEPANKDWPTTSTPSEKEIERVKYELKRDRFLNLLAQKRV